MADHDVGDFYGFDKYDDDDEDDSATERVCGHPGLVVQVQVSKRQESATSLVPPVTPTSLLVTPG